MPAILNPKNSSNIIYASTSGIILDGVTDQTAKVQAILDTFGAATKPLLFYIDGPIVLDTIYLYSNQYLDGAGIGKVTKKPYPGNSGYGLIHNKHWTTTGTTPTDQHMGIRNLYLDGNRRNGGSGRSPSDGKPTVNGANQEVPVIGWYGVQDGTIDNVYIYDSPAYGIHWANAIDCVARRCSKFLVTNDSVAGENIIQFQGGCYNSHAYNLCGSSNDDPWAMNANDGNDLAGAVYTFLPGAVVQGPIRHCSVQDSTFEPGYSSKAHFGRMLSSNTNSYIEHCLIRNITATCTDFALQFDNFQVPLGNGWYDGVTIENCTVYMNGAAPWIDIGAHGATVGRLTLRGNRIVPTATVSATSAVNIQASGTVGSLVMSENDVYDPNGYLGVPILANAGTLTHLSVDGGRLYRGASSTLARGAFESSGTATTVQFTRGYYDRISNVYKCTGGTTTTVNAGHVVHTTAGGGSSFAQTGGTFTTLRAAGNSTSSLNSGTIGTVTTG